VAPADQALGLIGCGVEPVLAARVCLHRSMLWLAIAEDTDIHAGRHRVLDAHARGSVRDGHLLGLSGSGEP
jgi:hypothetical protein